MPALRNPRHEAFAQRRAAAVITQEGVADSLRAIAPHIAPATATYGSRDLNARPDIRARIAELQAGAERRLEKQLANSSADMQIHQAVAYLVAGIQTPIADIDEHSPLAQEVTRETYGSGKNKRTRQTVKSISKIQSLTLLARMKGWTQEAAVSISFPGFVATVRDVSPAREALPAPSPA